MEHFCTLTTYLDASFCMEAARHKTALYGDSGRYLDDYGRHMFPTEYRYEAGIDELRGAVGGLADDEA